MTMTFYYGSGSPFAWRVWLALDYKQLAYDFKLVSFLSGELHTEDFGRLNPRRKVPVLIDDGFVLYESAAIVEYLDDRYPMAGAGRLFPEDVRQRAMVRRLILEADNYLSPGLRPMLQEVFHKAEAERDPAVLQQGRDLLRDELGYLERLLAGDYLLGPLTTADFTIYPMLALVERLEDRFAVLDLASVMGPGLRAWMARMRGLPCVMTTWPPHWKTSA